MWQKELKQLKKQISPLKKIKKNQTDEKSHNNTISFTDYCNSLNIEKLHQDKVINQHINKPKHVSSTANNVNYQTTHSFDFINIMEIPNELFHNGQKNLPRDLRSNKFKIDKTIDIHGLNRQNAWIQIESVIENSIAGTVIKIIHGQGINSEYNEPLLQQVTRKLIYNHAKTLAYTYGSPQQGGNGVTIVKLRK